MILRLLLFPFSLLYFLITSIRNYFYNTGWIKESKVSPVIVCVGNLRVGGTGKTPHVEYLVNLLKSEFKVSVLSRGYGRKTKGFLLADDQSNASQIGDEPFQIYSGFKGEIKVAVGEDRVLAVPQIVGAYPEINMIILDDGYQHRALARDLNILLTEYDKPFFSDFVLPAGRLRESRWGAKRADVVIVTKCPASIDDKLRKTIIENIRKYTKADTQVYFTRVKYETPQPLQEGSFTGKEQILLVSGIANPEHLEVAVRKNYRLDKHIRFSDHHSYSEKDVQYIIQQFNRLEGNNKCILLTEKDKVKFEEPALNSLLKGVPVFYLPIGVEFLDEQKLFDKMVLSRVRTKLESIES